MSEKDPHVFAIAEAAYSCLQNDNTNQACVISGESGAGKTESTKFILQYLCTITSNQSTWMEHQILEANTILEAFGNAKTVRNDNSSRFGKFIQVCFDSRYQIKGCIIQDYLLEQSRITFQSSEERNYHVFYQLVAAAQKNVEIRNQFLVERAENYAYLSQRGCYHIEGVDDSVAFDSLRLAMSVLNMPPEMCDGIFSVLSAILWLGNLQFEDYQDGERCKLKAQDEEILATVATLLGLDAVRLTQASLQRQINVRGNITEIPFKVHEARENRHSMAKALYSRTFAWIVNYINTCTSPGQDPNTRFLGVLDIFGFENFATNSFEQLCINYANEKLHRFFNHYVFALEQEMYRQEGINFSHINFTDNTPCLELLEKPPKCIFRLLTEECRVPNRTDTTYVNKLHSEFETHSSYIKGDDRRRWELEFGIKHYAGDVVYNVSGFLDKNKDVQQDQLFDLMAGSSNVFVKDLVKFQDLLSATATRVTNSTNSSRGTNPATATSKGRLTVADAFRFQLTALVDLLHSTNPWYVRCIKPNVKKASNCYDNSQVLTQLRYLGMLDIIRIRREGYPIHFNLSQFVVRYKCLLRHIKLPKCESEACIKVLQTLKMPKNEWQIGKNKVFLRVTVHEPLEEQRRILTTRMATAIQAKWKGYIQRREFIKMRHAAVIIQRHYRGHKQRLRYLRMRRAAITIQAFVRGMFAREVAAAMKEMKRVEEEMRRKEQEEQEKKLLQEQKKLLEEQIEKQEKEEMEKQAKQQNGETKNVVIAAKENESKDDSSKSEIDESVLIAQEEVQNITRLMEQSGFLQRKSACISSGDRTSVATSGDNSSTSEYNYVDLDKMFSFLSELQQENRRTTLVVDDEIGQQFDKLIETTEAQMNELENLKNGLSKHGENFHNLPPPPPSPPYNNSCDKNAQQLPPPPPNLMKPTQEVAPLHVNGNAVNNHQTRCQNHDVSIYQHLPAERNLSYDLREKEHYINGINGVHHHDGTPPLLPDNDIASMEQRRKMRVERKIMQLQEEQKPPTQRDSLTPAPENDSINLRVHEMLEFAERHFNTHVRDFSSGSSVIRTLTRRKKSGDENEILSKQEMLTWTAVNAIPTSHIHMYDPENVIIACSLFKDLCKYLQTDLKLDAETKLIQSIISKALERDELRDEIFVQLVRQSTNNPSREETLKAWVLLGLTTASFQPSKVFAKYLQSFLRKHLRKDAAISCYAQFCLDNLNPKGAVQTARRMPPSSLEINAVKTLSSLVCRFYFLDGRTKAIDIHSSDTASDAMLCLAGKIGLKNLDGWALYEHTPEYEKVIRGHDYLADIITQWEFCQKNSIYSNKHSAKHGPSALGTGDYRFVFKKRLFRNTREIPHDPVEVNLLYAQAVHSVVKKDEFPVSERIALQLSGLQAQVLLGEYIEGRGVENYDDIENYLCARVRKANANRSTNEWASKIAEAHRMYGSGKSDLIAKVWYLSVVMQYPLYGTTLFPVSYKGYLSYGQNLTLGINCEGILLINAVDKSILNAYRYCDIDSVNIYHQGEENLITFKLVKTVAETHRYFTFETKQKEEIAALVASYCPNLSHCMRKNPTAVNNNQTQENKQSTIINNHSQPPVSRRLLKMSLEDRMKFHQEVINARKVLIESGILRKTPEENLGFVRNTLRKLNKVRFDKIKIEYGNEYDSENFRHFPHDFWAYSKSPLLNSILVISDPELETAAINNFNAILTYSGLAFQKIVMNGQNEQELDESEWPRAAERDQIRLAQNIIDKCIRKDASDIFRNEFFLQLIKQTTDHPDPNSRVNIRHWQLMALACSITYPTDRRILAYLHAHLRKCSLDEITEEGQFAQFSLKNLQGTLETRGRKVTPSRPEIMSTINCRRIYARIHFLDGQFQAVEFDACATISEVIEQIQLKIGLRPNCPGYALYQNLGNTAEQALQPEEKVGDALAFWEKWHEEQGKLLSRKTQHFFVFKKHLFLDSFVDLNDPVEKELLFHQIIHSIRNDKFPITEQEAVMLCALKAQLELGDFVDGVADYRQQMSQCLPSRLLASISPEAVVTQHQTMKGMDTDTAKRSFFNLIQSWPLHRATLFEVTQTYTSSWPKNLWLAIDQVGMHLLELKTRNVLTSCDYRQMVDYSPTTNSLMIVAIGNNTGSKTVKYIFLTQQALQIAQLIRNYTAELAKERGMGRRKSVEFDLAPKPPKNNPPVPPPRPSLQQRQQIMEQTMYQNQFSSNQFSAMLQQQTNQFQATHRRSRPLSVLYKPPPIMMTEAEQV
ncbi:unconventional myosin-X-like protein [Dinothrombium tinctorium]|uniref:Unconventional myosin-X-like protein n=1 Tax=Dinothrombium tinctorium TaxID=1965070 RepID=A0A443R4H9_9ACAR|nr:unconventional myosin-X-like protein [Dinothrombium tinctorium]